MATAAAPAERYSTGAIWFHWVIAALVVFNIVVGLFHEGVPALRALMGAHKAVGITVLVLTLGRIGWRLAHRPPPLPAHLAAWETAAARLVRALFYVLLLAMPLSGWIMVSASTHPRPLSWFGLFDIPLLGVSHAADSPAGTTHAVLGYLFAALVVLHVAAALRHHFVLRDTVLGRVIPRLLPRG
ncbi:MAG TPA: cytochrome b [Sphingomonas sp.]|nr:cytochrome b [Sphingomonas sp.]